MLGSRHGAQHNQPSQDAGHLSVEPSAALASSIESDLFIISASNLTTVNLHRRKDRHTEGIRQIRNVEDRIAAIATDRADLGAAAGCGGNLPSGFTNDRTSSSRDRAAKLPMPRLS